MAVPLFTLSDDDFEDGLIGCHICASFGSGVGGSDVDCSEFIEWLYPSWLKSSSSSPSKSCVDSVFMEFSFWYSSDSSNLCDSIISFFTILAVGVSARDLVFAVHRNWRGEKTVKTLAHDRSTIV